MYDALLLLRVVVQLMRQLEKVVRPNVVHFSVVNPVTAVGVLRYVTLRCLCDDNETTVNW